jgi:hypothetical protein
MPELWQPVEGYEDLYEVSDSGRVRRLTARVWVNRGNGYWINRKGRLLKGGLDQDGYVLHVLSKQGKTKTHKTHHLVLNAFVGPCPDGLQTRHLNGRRSDNRVSNLAWGTPAEQMEDICKHGNRRCGPDHHFYGRTGENHWLYGHDAAVSGVG